MDPSKDAYGQEIWYHYLGKDSYEVVERDDGFMGLSRGASAYFAEFKQWPKEQQQAMKFAKGRCLDIGSGAGRISLYLQKKRHAVTAIDNSPLAIKVCKARGVKQAKVMPIEHLKTFKKNSFDTIVMMGNNFGLFANPKKAKRLLRVMHQMTSAQARIIAESADPYDTKDAVHLDYHTFNKKRGRLPGQLRIRIRFRKYIGDWFDYLLVSKQEMKEILKGTGWKVSKFIPSKSFTYIAIIEKGSP